MPYKYNPISGAIDFYESDSGGTVTSVSGTTNRITVTDGTAAAVVDIASNYVGQNTITTLGTIATGTWQGTAVDATHGGTNQTTYTTGDLLYASASNTLSKLAVGTTGDVLTLAAGVPSWVAPATSDPYAVSEGFDDFITSIGSTSSIGTLDWKLVSGGGSTTQGVGTTDHPGIISIGVTSTGGQMIQLGTTAVLLGGGEWVLEWVMRIPTLSDGTDTFALRLGFGDAANTSLAPTDGAWLSYTHSANSGAWVMNTSSNSSPTTANSASTVDTSWHKYKIVVNAAATSVAFYIDDVQMTNSPITATIPTGTGRETGIMLTFQKTAGSTARTMEVDTFYYKNTLTNSR